MIAAPGMEIRSEQGKEAWNTLLSGAIGVKTLDVPDEGLRYRCSFSLLLAAIRHNVTGSNLTDENAWKSKGESS
jgi:hypothetical protein